MDMYVRLIIPNLFPTQNKYLKAHLPLFHIARFLVL